MVCAISAYTNHTSKMVCDRIDQTPRIPGGMYYSYNSSAIYPFSFIICICPKKAAPLKLYSL